MRKILSLGVLLSVVALGLGVLKGAYIAIPIGLVALALLFLQREPEAKVIHRTAIPDRQELDDKIESIEEKFDRDRRESKVDVEKVKDFFDRIGNK